MWYTDHADYTARSCTAQQEQRAFALKDLDHELTNSSTVVGIDHPSSSCGTVHGTVHGTAGLRLMRGPCCHRSRPSRFVVVVDVAAPIAAIIIVFSIRQPTCSTSFSVDNSYFY